MNRYQNHLTKCVPPVAGGGGFSSAVRASMGRALAGRRSAVVNSSGNAGRAVFASGGAVQVAQVLGGPGFVRGASGCVSVSASMCRRHAFVASFPNNAFVWDRAKRCAFSPAPQLIR